MHDMILVFDLEVCDLQLLPDPPITVYSMQGLIAFVSPACEPLLGYRPEVRMLHATRNELAILVDVDLRVV